jgi:hypothetical protein
MRTMRIALMLLRQPVLLRRPLGTPWVQWLLLAVVAGFGALAYLFKSQAAAGLALLAGAALLLLWWGLFLATIGLQFGHRGAALVPYLRRIALPTTVAVCLCLVLVATLSAGGVFGRHALWALMAGWALAAVALIVAGRPTLGFLALAPLPKALVEFQDFAQFTAPLATPEGIAAGVVLLGASMFYALRRLTAGHDGDPAHPSFAERWSHVTGGTQPKPVKLFKVYAAIYAACLRRDCARRDRQNLLMHSLGSSMHWTGSLSLQIPMLLVSAASCLIPALSFGQTVALITGAMLAWPMFLLQNLARVAAGQPEQALLRLAPGMPASDGLNRMLASGLLKLFFKNWIAAMACAALLLALADVSQKQFIESMASMSVSVLLAAAMLRNFALGSKGRDRFVLPLLYGLTFVLMFSVMLLPAFAAFGSQTLLASGVVQLCLYLFPLSLAGLAVRWRWRAMLAAPPAFPAARF